VLVLVPPQDAKENNYTPLFEEHEYHGFVQSVLDAMEYQSFYRLMLASAATAAREERSSRGDSSVGGTRMQYSDSERLQHHSAKRSTHSRSGDRRVSGTGREHDEGEGCEAGCLRGARK